MTDSSAGQQGRSVFQWIGIFAGPLLGVMAWWFARQAWHQPTTSGEESHLAEMAGLGVLMAVWWLTEALPIAATAILPLALFPLFHVMPAKEVALCYGDNNMFLFLGGFLVALGVEECGLHRRLALSIVSALGDTPGRVVLGFMVSTWSLSMWLSNTATTMMMLPIATSVLLEAERAGVSRLSLKNFGISTVLGIAYSASIGGVATLIGTPTNLVFRKEWARNFADLPEITFAGWMALAAPLSAVFLLVTWWMLTRWLFPVGNVPLLGGREVIHRLRDELGPIRPSERRMTVIFLLTALLWIFREPVEGWGWAPALHVAFLPDGKTRLADDSTVAMLMAVVCFLVPSAGWNSKPLLTWEATVRVPWGILLIFGGGFALVEGMKVTQLDQQLGQLMSQGLQHVPPLLMVCCASLGMTFFTEVTSNVASTQMVLPLLAQTCQTLHIAPAPLMMSVTISASFAFMLPVATPPNAIVYGSGRVTMQDMIRAGFFLNLVGVLLVTAAAWLFPW